MNGMKNSIFLLFLSLWYYPSFAQTNLTGRVVNQAGEGIPYCAIGIRRTSIGTLADEQGHFKLTLADSLRNAEVIFSAVGYHDKAIAPFPAGRESVVVLEPNARVLQTLVVSAQKNKAKVVGEKSRPMLTFSRMFDQHAPAVEQGMLLTVPPEAWLNAFNFYIMPSSKYAEITLKLNIYEASNGTPSQSLQQAPILYKTTTTGWQTIDLSSYQLRATRTGKVAFTLQLVQYTASAEDNFIFGLSAKKSLANQLLFRYQSQGNWEKHAGTFIAHVAVSYAKHTTETPADRSAEPSEEPDAMTRTMLQVYQHHEAAKKTRYGQDSSGTYADLGDAKLYYEIYGQGEPLVLLHGNNGSMADFYQQIPALSKQYRVIALDTRGQGKSTNRSPADYTYDTFASDLCKLMAQLNLPKVHILGWSDGGNTGLSFARSYPEKVGKLIAIGANVSPDGIKEEVLTMFKNQLKQDSGDHRLLRLMLTQPQLTAADLQKITSPVLLIAGQNDVILESHSQLMQKLINNARLEIFPDATHYLPFEQAPKLNQLVLSFLGE